MKAQVVGPDEVGRNVVLDAEEALAEHVEAEESSGEGDADCGEGGVSGEERQATPGELMK